MSRDKLFDVADAQQGYFTARQAQSCGIARSGFHRRLNSGQWVKEMRGIYRLAQYPQADRPELVLYTLWSCNRKGVVLGVWSHETAMDIHDLSDVMPSSMHMTVPVGFRRNVPIPKVLRLHYAKLDRSEIEQRRGYLVTTALKTLRDVAEEGRISPDLIAQGLSQAFQRGIISRREVSESPPGSALMRIMREYSI